MSLRLVENPVDRLARTVEALLVIAPSPLTIHELATAAEDETERIETALGLLASRYREGRSGIVLEHVAGGYAFRAARETAEACARLVERPVQRGLSQAALETVAIVAYLGPVSRPEIARIRLIPMGRDCLSPAAHREFHDVSSMLDFVERLADASGLPVGIKSAVGELSFWHDLARAIDTTGRAPDFVTIDGGEGGTGAAPLVFSDHVSLPFKLGFTSVYREGFETVLFLQAMTLEAGALTVLQGVALGFAGVLGVFVLVVALERRLPHKKMLIATGLLITWVLVVMVGTTVQTMQKVGWIAVSPIEGLELPYWAGLWFGVFPTWQGIGAQAVAAVFVLGSYFAAEAVRKRRRARIVASSASTGSVASEGARV